MKKILLLCFVTVLLLSGCSAENTSSDVSSEKDVSASVSGYEVIDHIDPIYNDDVKYEKSTGNYANVNRSVLGKTDNLRMDYLSLPAIEEVTNEQLSQSIKNDAIKLSVTTANLGKGAKKGIKMEFIQNSTWGQAILAHKLETPLANGLTEEMLIDPVDGSLEAYQGIRFYLHLKRPNGRAYSICKFRLMFGAFYNYRSIYEKSVIIPDGDYDGYIDIPFAEMQNGYNQKPGASVSKIDYFGFNVSLEGSIEGAEVTVSDFMAYREMFW